MRVQNEGTGKSSWWMLNPDAKPGKVARRRATSMETSKYEKKRGRAKKSVDVLKSGLELTSSPNSSFSERLDTFPESPIHKAFHLSPDFRPSASSNVSSYGRLSPVQTINTDMQDTRVSTPPWGSCMSTSSDSKTYGLPSDRLDRYRADQLVGSLDGHPSDRLDRYHAEQLVSSLNGPPSDRLDRYRADQLVSALDGSSSDGMDRYRTEQLVGTLDAPSSDGLDRYRANRLVGCLDGPPSDGFGRYRADQLVDSLTLAMKLETVDRSYLVDCGLRTSTNRQLSSGVTSLNNTTYNLGIYGHDNGEYHASYQPSGSNSPTLTPLQLQQQSMQHTVNSQTFCTVQKAQSLSSSHSLSQVAEQHQNSSDLISRRQTNSNSYCFPLSRDFPIRTSLNQRESIPATTTSFGNTSSQVMGHLLSLNTVLPTDLDLNFDMIQEGLECDVEQIIRHELSVDGNLDFNFDAMNTNSSVVSTHQTTVTATKGTRPWVH
ncbi:uncharacterized protein LOC143223831 [Tachypleus tridentatus]|uniref:uncharacterized protein LOC143223831 n=1 Tax=Tachypleus tridentatus TaxID=6853 RepID=UPI003FD44B95